MKNIIRIGFSFLLNALLASQGWAQDGVIQGEKLPYLGSTYEYNWAGAGLFCGNVRWIVVGGEFSDYGNKTEVLIARNLSIKVRWVSEGMHTIKRINCDGENTTLNVVVASNRICCNQILCGGGIPNVLGLAPGATLGEGTYQWYSRANSTDSYSEILGAIGANYNPPEIPNGDVVTNTIYMRQFNSGNNAINSNDVTVTSVPYYLFVPTLTYSENTVKQASYIDIRGVQGTSSNAQVDFIGGDKIRVLYETILYPGVRLKINSCTSIIPPPIASRVNTAPETPIGPENINERKVSYLTAYPNPADHVTVIKYQVTQKGNVKLFITDQSERVVSTLVDKTDHEAGEYEYHFNSSTLKSGLYFYILHTPDFNEIKRLSINH